MLFTSFTYLLNHHHEPYLSRRWASVNTSTIATQQRTNDICRNRENDLIWALFYCQATLFFLLFWYGYKLCEADEALPVGWKAAAPAAAATSHLNSTLPLRQTTYKDTEGNERQNFGPSAVRNVDRGDDGALNCGERTTIDDQDDYEVRSLASNMSSELKTQLMKQNELLRRLLGADADIFGEHLCHRCSKNSKRFLQTILST